MHTEALQRHRINRAMNFAREFQSETLTLDDLADVACLSRYHFSRVFTNYCQETPIEYLYRIRLEQSVSNLMYLSGMSVTSIALDAGFSSSQAFSNAFSRRFGISPRTFRVKNSGYIKEFPKNQYIVSSVMSGMQIPTPLISQDWEVVLKTVPAQRLAYIRHLGPSLNLNGGRAAAIAKMSEWAKHLGIWRKDMPMISLCPSCPAVTPPQFCQSDICIAVDKKVEEDDVVSIQVLPNATVATLEIAVESTDLLMGAWRWFTAHWLIRSGMIGLNHASYETFKPNAGALGNPERGTTLCMPVLAKR